jgi:hypothetical protein
MNRYPLTALIGYPLLVGSAVYLGWNYFEKRDQRYRREHPFSATTDKVTDIKDKVKDKVSNGLEDANRAID